MNNNAPKLPTELFTDSINVTKISVAIITVYGLWQTKQNTQKEFYKGDRDILSLWFAFSRPFIHLNFSFDQNSSKVQ